MRITGCCSDVFAFSEGVNLLKDESPLVHVVK